MLAFGAFGIALGALGVYGVTAFGVAQRTAELGVRMALGATAAEIVPLVLTRGLCLIGGGVAIGAVLAVALNRALAHLLTEVGALDARTLSGAAVLILGAASLACLVPALKAARLDPVDALKET